MTNFQKLVRSYSIWDENNVKGFFGYGDGEYAFLSNFYPSQIFYCGNLYKTVEHAYQAAKCVEGVCCERTIKYINSLNSKEVKLFGNNKLDGMPEVTFVNMKDWNDKKYDVMLACIFEKFWRHNGKYNTKDLRGMLLNTGDKHLEESCHWHDNFWGNCVCPKCKDKQGQNNLGKILMKVRECLKR